MARPYRDASLSTLAAMDLRGAWRARAADDEVRRTGVGLGCDDSAWDVVNVPGHWRLHEPFRDSDGPVLYRTGFHLPMPGPGSRAVVTLHGVFYQADVWLDGAYLGDPEGYFMPHTFDVTDLCRLADDHVLAVEVTCPRPSPDSPRRTLTGDRTFLHLLPSRQRRFLQTRPSRADQDRVAGQGIRAHRGIRQRLRLR
jgi:beta-galactosidase/beta-glucuronidase